MDFNEISGKMTTVIGPIVSHHFEAHTTNLWRQTSIFDAMDPSTAARIKNFVMLRWRSLTYDEKLDILWLQATLREEGNSDVIGTIARLLGRANKTVQGVLAEFNASGDLSVAALPSNKTNHPKIVPNTREVKVLVRTLYVTAV